MPRFYRCGQCNTNWPLISEYAKCPGCEIPTAEMNKDTEILAVDEAKTKAAYLRFDAFLERETPEQTRARRARASKVDQDFAKLMDGAGYQDYELKAISELEDSFKPEDA